MNEILEVLLPCNCNHFLVVKAALEIVGHGQSESTKSVTLLYYDVILA